ncbi:hypothetical protein ACFYY9_18390 [Streptomyces nigra]|uniref:hypothetical protein n=1 Tax=Streptomyces nigra TaxID=1827580 RepID=UPI00367FA725
MSKGESTGNAPAPEPLPPQEHPTARARWARRARRMRNEAGLYLIRGAATAVGGAIVTYSSIWLHTR